MQGKMSLTSTNFQLECLEQCGESMKSSSDKDKGEVCVEPSANPKRLRDEKSPLLSRNLVGRIILTKTEAKLVDWVLEMASDYWTVGVTQFCPGKREGLL